MRLGKIDYVIDIWGSDLLRNFARYYGETAKPSIHQPCVEESGAATYSCLLLVSSAPHFCLCFVCNYGVPRQHLQVTLEYPMGPLRHGGIGPIHISTITQLCRCVFNIPLPATHFIDNQFNSVISIRLVPLASLGSINAYKPIL
jgi:hypothetical protein